MALPEEFLQELKFRSPLLELASNYTSLKRTGRSYVGLCPFHHEKTPSFHVYPEDNTYHCFGCHVGGDVITFVRTIENLDYIEAVRYLADRAGLSVPETGQDSSLLKLRTRILEMNRAAARFYHQCLNEVEGQAGLAYLQKRQLTSSTIRHFGLGFAPSDGYALVNHLESQGFSRQEMIQGNVAFATKSGGVRDRFVGRVLFPILDLRGNVVGFGGRTMGDDKPKYLNTSDTPVFQKSRTLFAMQFAKNSKADAFLLVEGYMDVIALHQAGFPQAVATLGTALTPQQAQLLSRYKKEVIVCYDSDQAGQNATARSISILREAGLAVRVLTIPEGKDPDEFIKSHGQDGAILFGKLLDQCKGDVAYRLQRLKQGQELQSPEGQLRYLNQAAMLLSQLDNAVERDLYLSRVAEEMHIEKTALQTQVEKALRKQQKERQKEQMRMQQQQMTGQKDMVNPEKRQHLRAATAEEKLIAYLLTGCSSAMAKRLAQETPPEQFSTAFNKRVYQLLLTMENAGIPRDLFHLSSELTPQEMGAVSRMVAMEQTAPLQEEDVARCQTILYEEQQKQKVLTEPATGDALQAYLQALKSQKQ